MICNNHPSMSHHQCPTCKYGPNGICKDIDCTSCPHWESVCEGLGWRCRCSYYEQSGEDCPHYEEYNPLDEEDDDDI